MKKLFILLTAIALISCSSDDDNPTTNNPTFSLDGKVYELQEGMNIIELKMSGVAQYNGESYDRSTINITGINGMSSTGTIIFDLYYKTGTTISGTYNIYDSEDDSSGDFSDFLIGQNRGCLGWTSSASVMMLNGGSDITGGNNPTGSIQIISNSATNYTVIYNGNFRIYDEDFDVVSNMPADINLSRDVTIHSN